MSYTRESSSVRRDSYSAMTVNFSTLSPVAANVEYEHYLLQWYARKNVIQLRFTIVNDRGKQNKKITRNEFQK